MVHPLDILKQYWGYDSFREKQLEIINSVLAGNDTLALLPTGGGKSICFQVPALIMQGVCVVVTPLIALMIDQVNNLRKRNISAYAIHSGLNYREIENIMFLCNSGEVKFLYLSPERLVSEKFLSVFKQTNVTLIAVDEAHCISEWGYDFRPPYLKIADIRPLFPEAPVIALTATAVPEIADDIQKKLLFKKSNIFVKSFVRTNLSYVVRKVEDKHTKIVRICNSIKGTGIVYVRNRRLTVEISKYLNQNNIKADYYHAGLSTDERNRKQDEWYNNKTRVMVSTNAFGMGIDKSDVRFVIHFDIPENIEAYYQEAGRAGRDEKKAYAVILYNNADIANSKKLVEQSWVSIDVVKEVYQKICEYTQVAVDTEVFGSFDFEIGLFCEKYKLKPINVFSAVKILEREGYIATNEPWNSSSKLMFTVGKEELFGYQEADAKMENLIKTILRMYGGVFSSFVNIDENIIARTVNIDRPIVDKMLEKLDTDGIISYLPKKTKNQLFFTSRRINSKDINLSREYYYNRKQNAIEKNKAMIYYLQSETCRSMYLVSYFGEKKAKPCGTCDYCLSKKRDGKKEKEVSKEITGILVKLLEKQELSVREIVSQIKKYSEADILNTIQSLIDKGILISEMDIIKFNKNKKAPRK